VTWTGRYSPEPVNDDLERRIRAGAIDALQTQSVLGTVVPRSIPADAIVRPFVTELPISAQDGDEIRFLADSDNGVVWHLRYRANAPSDYRWEFLGGPSLYAEVTTSQSTASGSFTDLGTVGPAVTLPAAGDYDVEIGAGSAWSNTNSQAFFMSYAIGSTAASASDAIFGQDASNPTVASRYRRRRKTGLGAVTLTAKYQSNGGATATFQDRFMIVTPVRLGRT